MYYKIGEILRGLRLEKGLRQADLVSGICSVQTYSRAERGERKLQPETLRAILCVLGIVAAEYVDLLLGAEDFEDFRFKRLILDAFNLSDHAALQRLIDEAKTKKSFQKGIKRQYLLYAEALVQISKNNDYEKAENILTTAIKLTKEDFSAEKVKNLLLGQTELAIINSLANVRGQLGDCAGAIDILSSLKENMEKYGEKLCEYSSVYSMVLYNLSKYLGLTGDYEKCLDICELGLDVCAKSGNQSNLGHLIFNKAYALHELGTDDEQLIIQAYYILDAQRDRQRRDAVKQYAMETFGFALPYQPN